MESARVAIRYVKSLLTLAQDQKEVERVHQDLQLFSRVVHESRDFVLTLRNPIIKADKKTEILHALFGKRVSPLTLAFFDIICRKGREGILPQIANTFHMVYNETKGIGEAHVTTAFPMDKQLRLEIEEISRKLSKKDNMELEQRVDKDLIGGFILQVGDRQLDTSVRSNLKKLKIQFSRNPFKSQL